MKIDLKITKQFKPFLDPQYRYLVSYGGRGGAKSWSIAQILVLRAFQKPTRILCVREVQRSISESVLQLLADTIERMGLRDYFDVQKTQIIGTNGSRFIFEGVKSNISKVKSMEGIDICFCEEADQLSYSSWMTLIPTVRKEGSQFMISFNPNDEMDDTYQRFVVNTPPQTYVVKTNWSENPWFPKELNKERLYLKEKNTDLYNHIWEGEVLSNRDGAYFAKFIPQDQIMDFKVEPNLPVDTFWDLGVSDSTCEHYAPHDIQVRELGTGKSRLETARKLGIHFRVVRRLTIEDGIHAARAILPKCYFEKTNTKDGLQALRRYRKEFDEKKGIYKPHPLHDWSSHYADAFRYFAIAFRDRNRQQQVGQPQANISWLTA